MNYSPSLSRNFGFKFRFAGLRVQGSVGASGLFRDYIPAKVIHSQAKPPCPGRAAECFHNRSAGSLASKLCPEI